MGKTSIARELGRRLEARGWVFLFTDVEGATCAEDVIANLAEAVHPVRSVWSRFATTMRWFKDNVEEFTPRDFRIKFRATLNAGNWHRYGGQLIRDCAAHEQPSSSSSTSCRSSSSAYSVKTTAPSASTRS